MAINATGSLHPGLIDTSGKFDMPDLLTNVESIRAVDIELNQPHDHLMAVANSRREPYTVEKTHQLSTGDSFECYYFDDRDQMGHGDVCYRKKPWASLYHDYEFYNVSGRYGGHLPNQGFTCEIMLLGGPPEINASMWELRDRNHPANRTNRNFTLQLNQWVTVSVSSSSAAYYQRSEIYFLQDGTKFLIRDFRIYSSGG